MNALDRVRWLFATACGLGTAKVAPGTFGTLGGVVIACVLQVFVPGQRFALAVLLVGLGLFALGCSFTGFCKRVFAGDDPQQFVLDEVVGYLLAIALFASVRRDPTPLDYTVAFVLFRAFDIAKPQPARRLEEVPGACGIMLDDVIAGLYAGLGLWLLAVVGVL